MSADIRDAVRDEAERRQAERRRRLLMERLADLI
jgi:hypothetical protein